MKIKMMKRMMKRALWLLMLDLIVTSAAGSGSCVSRCGESFTRGQQCTCDYSCLRHDECCHDFELVCTGAQSCGGRCSETFRRGRLCECDPECIRFSTCCHDYQLHCGSPAPSHSSPSVGSRGPSSPSSPSSPSGVGGSGGNVKVQLVLSHSRPMKGVGGPVGSRPRPSILYNAAHDVGHSGGDRGFHRPGAGLFPDVCSDSPISGLTALINGTVLIFKGDVFWSVDQLSRSVSRPQRITDALGVSAPIDTVFTRCNCEGNTYIIKGDQFWRLDQNMVLKPGYPRPLTSEFPGLTGSIRAALTTPGSRGKPETIYFFKRGDTMQTFSFPSGSLPSCSKNIPAPPMRPPTRPSGVSAELHLRGFPSPVTSTLSLPPPPRRDAYQHYVFTGPLFFSVSISGDLPVLVNLDPSAALTAPPLISPAHGYRPHPPNSIRGWLQCS
ncbi:uncharacterized protein LOC142990018 [Genypterus blacodes]|uniref:uncharacterized protein LOC142990018 n=1 Tax=Genypterus blacodes TaxID=154954 RepID=UPI003F7732C6